MKLTSLFLSCKIKIKRKQKKEVHLEIKALDRLPLQKSLLNIPV